MEKPVVISVKSRQTDENGPSDPIEMMTRGTLAGDAESGYTITYEESELTGMGGTVTVLRTIRGGGLSITRKGAFSSEMIFREGELRFTDYRTPYGEVTLGINTQTARAQLNENGGTFHVHYFLELDSVPISENVFEVAVGIPAAQPNA